MTKARDISSLIGSSGQIENDKITLDTNEIPNLDTAKITTGTFDDARMPSTVLNSNVDLTNLSATNLTSGTVPIARLGASGTKNSTTFLRGDNTFAEAGGGKLLQVATDFDSVQITIDSTTYTDTGLSINFTPTASNSTLLIFACLQIYTQGNGSYYGASDTKILHDGSTVQEVFTSLSDYQSGAFSYFRTHIASVASSNTNQRTIKVQLRKGGNAGNPTALYNQYGGNSSLIIQEIGA